MSALNPLVVVRRDRHKAVSGGEQPKTLWLSLGERHLLEESVGIEKRSIPKQVVFRVFRRALPQNGYKTNHPSFSALS